MRYHRSDIVERAVDVLDIYGLPDLSMRRIAGELGLQPSALYHHFDNKQTLLAAVADELLVRGARADVEGSWDEQVDFRSLVGADADDHALGHQYLLERLFRHPKKSR